METGKTLFEINLGYHPSTVRASNVFNGYLVWHRGNRTEIWRRASDTSGFQVFSPDEKQKKCVIQGQGLYDPVRENDPNAKRHNLTIKNQRPRGEFVPCGTITTHQCVLWHSFSFPLLYIHCSLARDSHERGLLVYDVRTLELVRSIENVIPGIPYSINNEHALLTAHRGFACIVDLATFRDELLFVGKDSWLKRVGSGIWRRTITDNIFTICQLEVLDSVAKAKLRPGMSPDKPVFYWREWTDYILSPDGCDIVRALSSCQGILIIFATRC
jgi:hypothetical protein